MSQSTIFPQIETLLPHRAPMILIDHVVSASQENICCSVTIRSDSTLYQSALGGVPAHAGIEYMAQTVAALAGLNARTDNQVPPVGLLLGARRYKHHQGSYHLGSTYLVEASLIVSDENMGVYDCSITLDGELVANGQLNTFVANEESLKEMKDNR